MYDYTVETTKSVQQTKEEFVALLQTVKFGVLWELDLQATLIKKGVDHEEAYTILEVCNPKEAKQLLDHNPLAGYFLPCKIAIYQTGQTTKIGMPRPSVQAEAIGDPKLVEIASEIEAVIIDVIDQVK